jgi:hypothetical protein
MRLDWNDIKARAAKFAADWKDARYERGETQTFYNEFFELFGVTRRRVASFEHGVNLPAKKRGFLDLFWKGKLLIEQKSAGLSLTPARKQALDYFPGLKEHELPRYILLSDFQSIELYDLDIAPDRPLRFRLQDLPDHVQDFGFIVGQEWRIFRATRILQTLRHPNSWARCMTRSMSRAIAATTSNVSLSASCFAFLQMTPGFFCPSAFSRSL